MFNFLRKHQAVVRSSCAIFIPHWKRMWRPVPLHLYQHSLLSVFLILAIIAWIPCTTLFYRRDLSIHGLWYLQGLLGQFAGASGPISHVPRGTTVLQSTVYTHRCWGSMCTHMCLCVCVCSGRFGKRNVRRPDVSGSDEETVSTLYILCSQHYLGFLTLGRAGEEHVRRLPVKVREAESGNISESARSRCQARTGILLPPSGGSFCRAVCPPHQHRGETHRPVPSYQQPSSSGVFPSQTSHIPAFSECDPESRR